MALYFWYRMHFYKPLSSSEIFDLSLDLVGFDSEPTKYRPNPYFSATFMRRIFRVRLVDFTERFIAHSSF